MLPLSEVIDYVVNAVEGGRALRFTPRRAGSPYSRPNMEHLIWLYKQGMIHLSVQECVADLISAPYVFPEDIMAAIRADAARKRPEAFRKRPDSFLRKTREGKLIPGYGGIDKYYD